MPKLRLPIVLIAALMGVNAILGLIGVFTSSGASGWFYTNNAILIALEATTAVGLVLRWRLAYFLVLVWAALLIVGGGGVTALVVGFAIIDPPGAHIAIGAAGGLLLLGIGAVVYRYFRKREIAAIYLPNKI